MCDDNKVMCVIILPDNNSKCVMIIFAIVILFLQTALDWRDNQGGTDQLGAEWLPCVAALTAGALPDRQPHHDALREQSGGVAPAVAGAGKEVSVGKEVS